MNLLTDEEMEQLTGSSGAAKQKEILDKHGIYYIERMGGKSITTTWHHVNHPFARQVSNADEPDFGAMTA